MKKIIAIILSAALIIAVAAMPANAAEIKKGNATDYPYIFVHGMGGWGPDNSFYDTLEISMKNAKIKLIYYKHTEVVYYGKIFILSFC